MKFYILTSLLFISVCLFVKAQTVTGKIVDISGNGLDSLNVQLYSGTAVYNTTTNSDGSFTFNNVTKVEDVNSIPGSYAVSNNYPNPFNPKTRINITLPKASKVSIKIYNILGQRVKDIPDQVLPTGVNFVDIDLNGLSNGIYLAHININDDYSTTKKLVLIYGSQHLVEPGVITKNKVKLSSIAAINLDSIVVSGTSIFTQVFKNLPSFQGSTVDVGNLIVTGIKTNVVVDKNIGATIITPDGAELMISQGALPNSGDVYIGHSGEEPTSVANQNLEVTGYSFTIGLPADSLLKPIQFIFHAPTLSVPQENYSLFLFNGKTYFPIMYYFNAGNVWATIDKVNWNKSYRLGKVNSSSSLSQGEFIVLGVVMTDGIPISEIGLKEDTLTQSGTLSFSDPSIGITPKILLFIHGLTNTPEVWKTMIQNISSATNNGYTDFLTFGYNPTDSITANGTLLLQELQQYLNGNKVDIVAHGMGGLVARSMIENSSGAQYVNKLITLGTQNLGSPSDAIRGLLGYNVSADNPLNTLTYSYNTQGIRDITSNSIFLNHLELITNTPPVPYFLIAARNNPSRWFNSGEDILPGPDDGAVTDSSALGVSGFTDTTSIYIPVGLAHTVMPDSPLVSQQVLAYLLGEKPAAPLLSSPLNGSTIQSTSLTFSWNSSSGATSYSLQIAQDNLFSNIVYYMNGIIDTSQQVTGLDDSTTYYWRVSATNSYGTSDWSNVNSFDIIVSAMVPLPPVLVSPPVSATNTSLPIFSWNASNGATSYTIQVTLATDLNFADLTDGQSGLTGTSFSLLNGQRLHAIYEWRVNASNSYGTSGWSEIRRFTTGSSTILDEPCPGMSTVTDSRDGHIYNTVQIGDQCWLKENMNIGTRINGGYNAQSNNGIIEKFCYDDDPNNCSTYGGLYEWNEAMQYATNSGAQGICPNGWHIPTESEVQILESTTVYGNSLKAVGQGTGDGAGTNTTGFSGLLSGFFNGLYYQYNRFTYFWNSTASYTYDNIFALVDNYKYFGGGSLDKVAGLFVRCIKDQ